MTVLGVQLVFTLICVVVVQRLNKRISFGQWLLCSNLFWFVCPTDGELRQAAGVSSHYKQQKPRRRRDNHQTPGHHDTFTVPKSTDFTLYCSRLTPAQCLPLKYYSDFQWLLDISLSAVVVYIFTEIYRAWSSNGTSELNLSLIWCFFVMLSIVKLMIALTAQYFKSEAEWILCCIFGLFFLVLSMGVLVTSEELLDFGLENAHNEFSTNAQNFLKRQGIQSQGPLSLNTFKIIIALISAIIGLLMTFPGIRYAKMHVDALRHARGKSFMKLLLYVNFMFPSVLVLLWVKPAVFNHITEPTGLRPALVSEESFYTIRLWYTVLFCLLRCASSVPHLQAHLNMAQDRVLRLKSEVGRISNVDLQKVILHVHYYLCVVAVQYFTPVLLLLFMCFVMKTLGGLRWMVGSAPMDSNSKTDNSSLLQEGPMAHPAVSLTELNRVFTHVWYHGIFSYFTFWILVTWSVTSLFGTVYHSQFSS